MNHPRRRFLNHHARIQEFVLDIVDLVLERLEENHSRPTAIQYDDSVVRDALIEILEPLAARYDIQTIEIADRFTNESFQKILTACEADYLRYPQQDPAMSNLEEVFYASNGLWATVAYRVANALKRLRVPVIPRTISGIAHSKTGIDIHPGATIGPGLFIDHGTGIAIGCTAILEENVNLYNGVVLGTRSKPAKKTNADSGGICKRHPTIKRGVSLYTNAFVGGDVTIGECAVIGAYAFVTDDVQPGQLVTGKSGSVVQRIEQKSPESGSNESQEEPAILGLIGNTPMIEIRSMHRNRDVRIFAKLEGANPSGSVKDRIALSLIERAEASGALMPGKVILESTSGNTGIGLAMVGAAKGYEVVLTMSSAMSEERKKVLRALGATLIETDPAKGTGGAIEVARRMAAEEPDRYWMANQHASLDNSAAHYERTAPEILDQVPEVTHFVAGIGTFGTLRGAGSRLREDAGVKVIGVEPRLGQPIQGLRNMTEPFSPELYDESLLDQKIIAMADAAYETTRRLASQEGLLVGMSSGAAMHAAIELSESIERGTIVVIFPDRGEKYLSTSLFDFPATETEREPQDLPHAEIAEIEPQFEYQI